jgi:hypothetical protein
VRSTIWLLWRLQLLYVLLVPLISSHSPTLVVCNRHQLLAVLLSLLLPVYTLQAIRMQEDSKGRSLSAAEKQELAGNPLKLLQSLLPSIGALYSGLQPAAIETTASNAVSSLTLLCTVSTPTCTAA